MRRMWTRALLLGALGLAGGSVMGCAQERAPINRVQADALAKSFFVGADLKDISDDPEFYMRGTVVDVGYGAAQDGLFTSTYAQPISRIRWEITEKYLNARLSYERIASSDGKGNQIDGLVKKKSNDGQIVASYAISSHFDIRRAYNPTTGEEQNVVEENTTDRPWYDREYFRVDWSQNLATDSYDYDTLTSLGWIGGVEYEPLSYTVLDPNNPDAPHFVAEEGYFDVTNKAFAKPALIDLSSLGWGIDKIPACMLPGDFAGGSQPYGDCNPIEITIRQSFRKVVDKDYQPLDYDGYRFQAFGVFTTERQGYARDYGMTDAQWHRFASRYNIWERSHYYDDLTNMKGEVPCATKATTEDPTGDPNADPNRDDNHNGTADECEVVSQITGFGGSQCDIFNKKCTMPYQARTPVTIPWYINGAATTTIDSLNDQIANATDSKTKADLQAQLDAAVKQGEDYFEATNWAVQEWDLALKTAIVTSRQVECKRDGGGDTCKQNFPMWTGQQEDIDEAVSIARVLDKCRRDAALGSTNPDTITDSDALTKQRDAGWTSQDCIAKAKAMATQVASDRKNPNDPSAAAMASVVPMDPVIVLCHNPVQAGDHKACGAVGLSPRLGDIRYNTVLNIDKPQQPSAWGIMVDADDPLTGEKVAASINIWTHVTDIASQSLVDLVRYVNGELKTSDITDGTYISNWAKAAQLGSAGNFPVLTKNQIDTRLAAASHVDTAKYQQLVKQGMPAALKAQVKAFQSEKVSDLAVSTDVASPSAYGVQARMNLMRNSQAEAKLMNPAMLQLAGVNGTVPQGSALDQASPMALNNPRVTSQLSQMREVAMASRGACVLNEAPELSSLTGIADAMKRKFPKAATETPVQTQARYDAMLGYIRRKYHYAVLAHEVGHSVGLRHNFVSTYAALHFRPQYWQLRTKNGSVTTACDPNTITDGSACVGPRYIDPLTDEEQSQMIWMFMQSTVMDYPGDVSQDTLGLGVYDFGAARMFYGDSVSVYDVKSGSKLDPNYLSNGALGNGIISVTDNFGGLVGIQYGVGGGTIHYSQLQTNYNLISNCQTVTPTQPEWWREDVDGKWDPLFDGHVVTVDGKATKCRTLPVDYLGWNDLRMPSSSESPNGNTANYRGGNAVDAATKRVRVPYSFASDNWADTGNVSVFRHDNGADPYEQTTFLITTQENRHILDNFRRGRTTFNVRGAADRSYSRYNEKLLDIAGGIGFLANIYKDFATASGFEFNDFWPMLIDAQYKENMIGATVAFDHFSRELSRPESGPHYFAGTDGCTNNPPEDGVLRSASDADGISGKTVVIVPEGSTGYLKDIGFGGHLMENSLAADKGDYDVDYTLNAGSYYDKINTAILLSLSEDRFISQSRQDFYDARFRAVGMADVLPDGWRRLIANALTGDRSILAPHVTATGGVPDVSGKADPNDPKNVDAKLYPKNPLLWTSWYAPEGPQVCGPSNGVNLCEGLETGNGLNPVDPTKLVAIDPQIGWEVQKFLIAWTLAYIPADQQAVNVDMMRIYRLGPNADPSFDNRIEWQDPASGQTYYAKTYGKECLFGTVDAAAASTDAAQGASCLASGGKWVQKGIAARVLEYANELTSHGYALDTANFPKDVNSSLPAGFNAKGRAMVVSQPDGTAVVASDPTVRDPTDLNCNSTPAKPTCDLGAPVDCDPASNNCDATKLHPKGCSPLNQYDNHWAIQLAAYKEVPDYLWEVVIQYNIGTPDQLGVFPN